jgi:hypothetical protein
MALPTAEPVRVTKQYRMRYRCDNGVVCYESVQEEDGLTCSELLIWNADGNLYRQSIGGVDLAAIRREWEAASPFDKVQVPNDAGRKVWTHLEPEPEPVAVPEPEPVAVPVDPAAAVAVSRDPQYEPWKAPRDAPLSRELSWGPGNP